MYHKVSKKIFIDSYNYIEFLKQTSKVKVNLSLKLVFYFKTSKITTTFNFDRK